MGFATQNIKNFKLLKKVIAKDSKKIKLAKKELRMA